LAILGPSWIEDRDRQAAAEAVRQVAEEREAGAPIAGNAPHRMPSGTPMSDERRAPEMNGELLCQQALVQPRSSGAAGGDVKAVTSARPRDAAPAGTRVAGSPLAGAPPLARCPAFWFRRPVR